MKMATFVQRQGGKKEKAPKSLRGFKKEAMIVQDKNRILKYLLDFFILYLFG